MGNTVVIPSFHDWYSQPLRKQKITLVNHHDAGQFFLVFEGKNSQNQDIIIKAYEYNEPLQNLKAIKESINYFKKLSEHSAEITGIVNFTYIIQDNMVFLFRPKFEKSFNFVEFCSYQQPILEPVEKLFIFYQLYSIIKSLHDIGLEHGDLKPSNIFVNGHDLDLCVVDPAPFKPNFILESRLHVFYHYFTTSSDSGCYLAPERILGIFKRHVENQNNEKSSPKAASKENGNETTKDIDEKDSTSKNNFQNEGNHIDLKMADVFSFGCIVAFLYLNGEHIFDLSKLHKYANGKIDIRKDLTSIDNELIIDIIVGLISLDIEERRETMNKLDHLFDKFFSIFSKLFCEFRNDKSFRIQPQEHIPKFAKIIHRDLFENGRLLLFNFFFDQLLKMDQVQSIIYCVQEITKFITYTKDINQEPFETEISSPSKISTSNPFKSIEYPDNGGISTTIKMTRVIPLFMATINNSTGSPSVFRQCLFSILDIFKTIDQIPPFLKDYIDCYLKIELDKLIIMNKGSRFLPVLANVAPFYIYRLKRFVQEDALLPLSSSFSSIFGAGSTPYVFSIFAHSMITVAHTINHNNANLFAKQKAQNKESKAHKKKDKEKVEKNHKKKDKTDNEDNKCHKEKSDTEKDKKKEHKDKKKTKQKEKSGTETDDNDEKVHKDKKKIKEKSDNENDEKVHKDKKKHKEKSDTDTDANDEKTHKDKKKIKTKEKSDTDTDTNDGKSHKDKKKPKEKSDTDTDANDEKAHKDKNKKKPKEKSDTDTDANDEKAHKDKKKKKPKEKSDTEINDNDEKTHKNKKKSKEKSDTDTDANDEKALKDKKKLKEKEKSENDEKVVHKDKKKHKTKSDTETDDKTVHKDKKKPKEKSDTDTSEKVSHKDKKKVKEKSDTDKDDTKSQKEKKTKTHKKKDKDNDTHKENHKKKCKINYQSDYDDIYSDDDFEQFEHQLLKQQQQQQEEEEEEKKEVIKNNEYKVFDYDTYNFDSGFSILNSFFFYILSVYNNNDVYYKKEALKIILEFYKCSKYNIEDKKKYHQVFSETLFPVFIHILTNLLRENTKSDKDNEFVCSIFDFLSSLCDSNEKVYSLSEAPLDPLGMFTYSIGYQFYSVSLDFFKKTTDPMIRYHLYRFLKTMSIQIKDFVIFQNFLSLDPKDLPRIQSRSNTTSFKKRVSFMNNGEFWSFQSVTNNVKKLPLITSKNDEIVSNNVKNKKSVFSPRFIASFHAESIPISHVLCTSGICIVIDKSNRVRWISLPQIPEKVIKDDLKNNIDINFNFLFHNERFVNNVKQLSQIRSSMLREKVTAASMMPKFTSPFNSTSFLLGYDNGSIDQHDLSTCQKSRIFDGFNRVYLTSRSSNMSRDSVSVPTLNSIALNSVVLNSPLNSPRVNGSNLNTNSNINSSNSALSLFSDFVSDSAVISIKPISDNCIVFANKRGSVKLIDSRSSESILSLSFDQNIGGVADLCTWNGIMIGVGFSAGAIAMIDTRMFQPFIFNVLRTSSLKKIIPMNSRSDQISPQISKSRYLSSFSFLTLNDDNEEIAEVYREPLNKVVLTYNCKEENLPDYKIRTAIPFAGGAIALDDISASFITLNTQHDASSNNNYDTYQSRRIYNEFVLPLETSSGNEDSEVNLSISIPMKAQSKIQSVHMHNGKIACASSYFDRNTNNNSIISCDDLGFVNLWNVTSG